ncbi:MAG: hypothetical protein Q4G33_13205 [bacterium]|nr:hypothetical protein [bacterium]
MSNNNMPPGKKKSGGNSQYDARKAELEAIKKLPLRKITAGNVDYTGYYDEERLVVYLADQNGELTGQKATIRKPLPPPEYEDDDMDDEEYDNQRSAGETGNASKQKIQNSVHDTTEKFKRKKIELVERKKDELQSNSKDSDVSRKKKSKLMIILIICAILAAGSVALRFSGNQSNAPTTPGQTTVAEPKEGEITVIELKQDVLPGDTITEDIINASNIDSQTYNQIAINGNDLYKWEQRDNIIGMYAGEFISKGKYLTTNALTRTYKVEDNPWGEVAEGMKYADVPINIKDFDRTKLLIGNKIKLHFQIDRKEDSNSETQPSMTAGITVTKENNAVVTESYTIDNVVIANLLTGSGDSLYEIYSALASIPEGNQESYFKTAAKRDKEYLTSIAPTKIRVIFDKTYAEALEKAVSSGAEITVELQDNGKDVGTEAKQTFYSAEQTLMESLGKVL